MAWTEITRAKYRRDGLRYASDTTDKEWCVIEPHLPAPARCGRTRETDLRDVVDAIFYIAQSGCQWRMLPKEFPPFHHGAAIFLCLAGQRSVADHQSCAADVGARGRWSREAQPDRGRDRQPVGQDHRGRWPTRLRCREDDQKGPQKAYSDRYNRPAGRDDRCIPPTCKIRDGAPGLLASVRRALFPWLRHVFADAGYAGDKLKEGQSIISAAGPSRSSSGPIAAAKGFVLALPRRWVVERTFRMAQSQSSPGQRLRGDNQKRR